jgi:hypothetical protein
MEPPVEQAIGHSFERAIRHGVGVFCIAVWAVIGIVYWIPLLARSCGAYSAAVIFAVIARRPPDRKAVRMLDVASNFYLKGFQDIRASVFGDRAIPDEVDDAAQEPSIFTSWNEFFRALRIVGVETAIAILFWGLIFLLLHHIF